MHCHFPDREIGPREAKQLVPHLPPLASRGLSEHLRPRLAPTVFPQDCLVSKDVDYTSQITCLFESLTHVKQLPENHYPVNILIQPKSFCEHQWTRMASQACPRYVQKHYASCHSIYFCKIREVCLVSDVLNMHPSSWLSKSLYFLGGHKICCLPFCLTAFSFTVSPRKSS